MLGWEVTIFTRDYTKKLIEYEFYEDAFSILKQMPTDSQVRELLNEISLEI